VSGSFPFVAAEKDDPGVLGNLPRSRPGRRSEKRSSGAGARKQPAAGGTSKRGSTQARASATSQRAKRSTGAKSGAKSGARPATPKTRTPPRPTTPPRDTGGGGDPLSQAVRLGGKVAETGVKTAVGILRRITGR
jgi:hypothetical protein